MFDATKLVDEGVDPNLAQEELDTTLYISDLHHLFPGLIQDFYDSYDLDGLNPFTGETAAETSSKLFSLLKGQDSISASEFYQLISNMHVEARLFRMLERIFEHATDATDFTMDTDELAEILSISRMTAILPAVIQRFYNNYGEINPFNGEPAETTSLSIVADLGSITSPDGSILVSQFLVLVQQKHFDALLRKTLESTRDPANVTLSPSELVEMFSCNDLKPALSGAISDFYNSFGGDGSNPKTGVSAEETAATVINILDSNSLEEIEVKEFVKLLKTASDVSDTTTTTTHDHAHDRKGNHIEWFLKQSKGKKDEGEWFVKQFKGKKEKGGKKGKKQKGKKNKDSGKQLANPSNDSKSKNRSPMSPATVTLFVAVLVVGLTLAGIKISRKLKRNDFEDAIPTVFKLNLKKQRFEEYVVIGDYDEGVTENDSLLGIHRSVATY